MSSAIRETSKAPKLDGNKNMCLNYHCLGQCRLGNQCPRKASHIRASDTSFANQFQAWVANFQVPDDKKQNEE